MREDSPRWEQINPSAFAHEQDGLRDLASYLPDADPYHVWANVEFVGTDGSINEIDALVLTPSGLFVLELKHWQGEIRGDGTQWVRRMPNGRLTPEDSPYILANRKAKRLASLIQFYARQQGKQALTPFVGAAVFLHARTMTARLDEIGRQHVYGLDGGTSGLDSLKTFLLDRPRRAGMAGRRAAGPPDRRTGQGRQDPSVGGGPAGRAVDPASPTVCRGCGLAGLPGRARDGQVPGSAGAFLPDQPRPGRRRTGDQAGGRAGVSPAAGHPPSGHRAGARSCGSCVGSGVGVRSCRGFRAARPLAGRARTQAHPRPEAASGAGSRRDCRLRAFETARPSGPESAGRVRGGAQAGAPGVDRHRLAGGWPVGGRDAGEPAQLGQRRRRAGDLLRR